MNHPSTAAIAPLANPRLQPEDTGLSIPLDNLNDVIAFSEQMAKCQSLPDHLRGKVADCFRIVLQCQQWRLNPYAVAEKTSLIHGKMMYEGQLVAAVVNARGNLSRRLDYKYEGAIPNLTLTVFGTIRGETEPREIRLTYAQAIRINKNENVAKGNTEQQMAYIGARIWARRHMPELLLGVYTPDEFVEAEIVREDTPSNRTEGDTLNATVVESTPAPAPTRRRRSGGIAAAAPATEVAQTPLAATDAPPPNTPSETSTSAPLADTDTAATTPTPTPIAIGQVITANVEVTGINIKKLPTPRNEAGKMCDTLLYLDVKGEFNGCIHTFDADNLLFQVGNWLNVTLMGRKTSTEPKAFITKVSEANVSNGQEQPVEV